MKCVLLTTDTLHHRFFANFLARISKTTVILENRRFPYTKAYKREIKRRRNPLALVDNPYLHLPSYRFSKAQNKFERELFFCGGEHCFVEGLDISQVFDVNDSQSIALINASRPDLLISFGTGILKDVVLSTNCVKVNIHRGILPDYRGLDSDLWASYKADFFNIGTTIHELDVGIDTGAILLQRHLRLKRGMRISQIRYFTTMLAAEMVRALINADLRVPAQRQDVGKGNYYSFIPPLKRALAIWRFNRFVESLQS